VTVAVPRALWAAGELLAVDRLVHDAEDDGGRVEVVAEDPAHAGEVALRYQRLALRTNAASADPAFQAVLGRHRARHDTRLPLVRADLDHALDTWQWALRLDAGASAEVQLAALLHDVERLESEAVERVEHRAADYQAFKDAHARRGAEIVGELLEGGAWDVGRVQDLVARHERVDPEPERVLLADADALSFFAVNSAGYLAYFGPEATARKVAYTLGRSSARVGGWLGAVRLPPAVRAMVDGSRSGPT
jgi:hypothetical protein